MVMSIISNLKSAFHIICTLFQFFTKDDHSTSLPKCDCLLNSLHPIIFVIALIIISAKQFLILSLHIILTFPPIALEFSFRRNGTIDIGFSDVYD